MKSLTFASIVALAAGIALIIANKSIYSTGVVVTGGIIFIVAGILNAFVFNNSRKREKQGHGAIAGVFTLLTSIGAAVLGICMLIFQDTFIALVPCMFGIIVAFLGLYQFYVLAVSVRPAILPAWFYIAAVILLGIAVFIFLRKPSEDDSTIMLATGIALTFFGVMSLIEASMTPHFRKKAEAPARLTQPLDEENGHEAQPNAEPKAESEQSTTQS